MWQCDKNTDLGSGRPAFVSTAGLHVYEPPLVTLGLSLLLYTWAWLTRALLALLAWLRDSASWTLQALPELRDSAQLPGWTAPAVLSAEAFNSQHLDSTSGREDGSSG